MPTRKRNYGRHRAPPSGGSTGDLSAAYVRHQTLLDINFPSLNSRDRARVNHVRPRQSATVVVKACHHHSEQIDRVPTRAGLRGFFVASLGAVPCRLYCRGESRKRAKSSARSCRALHVCAVEISAGRGRGYSPSRPPKNLRCAAVNPFALPLTSSPASASHHRNLSWRSSAPVSKNPDYFHVAVSPSRAARGSVDPRKTVCGAAWGRASARVGTFPFKTVIARINSLQPL